MFVVVTFLWSFLFVGVVNSISSVTFSGIEVLESNSQPPVNSYPSALIAQMMREIAKKYDKKIIPKRNLAEPIEVMLSMSPMQLISVDEAEQTFTILVAMREEWDDDFYTWDAAKYGNVSEIHVPSNEIWTSDMVIFNRAEISRSNKVDGAATIVMRSNGTERSRAIFLYPLIAKVSCAMKVTKFPFDEQVCHVWFVSSTVASDRLRFTALDRNCSMAMYQQDSQWEMFEAYSQAFLIWDNDTRKYFSLLSYHFQLRRRPLFYIINVVIPASILSFINFLGFFTPSSSSGRRKECVVLGLTTVVALGVFMLQVVSHTPKFSVKVPLLGKFCLDMIVMVGMGILISQFVINMQQCGLRGSKVSGRLIAFMRLIAHLFRWLLNADELAEIDQFLISVKKQQAANGQQLSQMQRLSSSNSFVVRRRKSSTGRRKSSKKKFGFKNLNGADRAASECSNILQLNANLRQIRVWLEREVGRLEREECTGTGCAAEEYRIDWSVAANVLSRLCLFVFWTILLIRIFFVVFVHV